MDNRYFSLNAGIIFVPKYLNFFFFLLSWTKHQDIGSTHLFFKNPVQLKANFSKKPTKKSLVQ